MDIQIVIEVAIGAITIVGAPLGAYVGAKTAIAVLEQRMKQAEIFIEELREWKHHRYNTDYAALQGDLLVHDKRITKLEYK